jgi:hypothetical protein
MTTVSPYLTRRAVLGAALAASVLPYAANGQEGRDPARQEPTNVRIRMTFKGLSMTATLYDNPTARDFASMLPLDLTIEDFSSDEKIVHLPRKLTEEGSGPFGTSDRAIFATSSLGATWPCITPTIAGRG